MAGDRSRGDASRRDSESPRREGRRQDRLGRVLGSMLGSAQTVNTNPGSQQELRLAFVPPGRHSAARWYQGGFLSI